MFDTKYYKSKLVITDKNNQSTLLEKHATYDNLEYYLYVPTINGSKYEVYVRQGDNLNLDDYSVKPLGLFLQDQGYNESDFSNPFTRTKKIVREIEKLNLIALRDNITKQRTEAKIKRIGIIKK